MKKNNEEKTLKQLRNKKYWIRKTIKEVKRVRWPDAKTNTINFVRIIIFTAIFALFVYGVTLAFTKILEMI
ncbi:preprotein translocase subunit SecE [Mycoplasma sp. CSL10137]|uniref:preprotein translocase subunit SecE n=1 Tax=unclassified Mycoplasma TaxID=2683645 RepID=UPI00197B299A|nr:MULTISPECIES: preprotein translocase subunit SecE [unclassified Mycoplasma]MBN4083401.1 preprotein translocase subunit SecE [Mycoplasma sp. CSL10137]MBN4084297.1 preprotein translocase subunit SecE [Mycoplasma sp. CSL10166]MBU4692769.1 preprotein translocase subunit SecE [Mycoplasma sp. CSL7491-lung]MCU4706605.1 preprotein translocase subunit SecE [Mycoplasma sp. CSL7503-lung]